MLAVYRCGGANVGQLGKGDGLALVLQIPVFRDCGFAVIQRFEHHHGLALQPGGIKGERDVDGTLAAGDHKGGFRRDGSFPVRDGFAGGLEHQLAPEGVLLARSQTAVLHRVGDGDLFGGFGGLFAVDGGGGANGGLAKGHGLALIVDVRMGCHHILALIQALKDHHGLTGQGRGVESVGELHGSLRGGGRELQLRCDLLLVDQQGLASLSGHKHTGNLIGFAHL